MDIIQSTQKYEAWLGDHIPLIKQDLDAKHQAMHAAAFPFLRATFYRWMQLWPETCPELADLPKTWDETRLLTAMGFETANIHLGSGPAAAAEMFANLKARRPGWLLKAGRQMVKATLKDWEAWKSRARQI